VNAPLDAILVGILLTGFLLLGSSRLVSCIRTVALQGMLLGFLTLAAAERDAVGRAAVLTVASTAVKGFVFPWLLVRVLRGAQVRREIEPLVGYGASLLVGLGVLGLSLWLGTRLPRPDPPLSTLLVPVALFTMLVGLVLIVTRRKALTQVLGYLVMENGIYAFGAGLVQEQPILVELGILLDVLVAVFVMGIAIFHINRQFDHIDTDRMAALRDWTR
jgi:hydrogenase-4 component E